MLTMLFFVLPCLFSAVIAESTFSGCPNVTLNQNIDFNKILGVWYTAAFYRCHGQEAIGNPDCVEIEYKEDDFGYTSIGTTYLKHENVTATLLSRIDRMSEATNMGEFVISHLYGDKVEQLPFSILSSDYTDYAILYGCNMLPDNVVDVNHGVFYWVFSRQKVQLEGERLQKIQNILSTFPNLANIRSFNIKDFLVKYPCP